MKVDTSVLGGREEEFMRGFVSFLEALGRLFVLRLFVVERFTLRGELIV